MKQIRTICHIQSFNHKNTRFVLRERLVKLKAYELSTCPYLVIAKFGSRWYVIHRLSGYAIPQICEPTRREAAMAAVRFVRACHDTKKTKLAVKLSRSFFCATQRTVLEGILRVLFQHESNLIEQVYSEAA